MVNVHISFKKFEQGGFLYLSLFMNFCSMHAWFLYINMVLPIYRIYPQEDVTYTTRHWIIKRLYMGTLPVIDFYRVITIKP